MKKRKILALLVICIILVTGCGETKKKELETSISKSINIDEKGAALVCTTDYDYNELNYVIGSKYVVFADKDNKVTKISSKEVIVSTDESKLDEFENYLKENHEAASQYNGYIYDVKREKEKVTSSVTIDYSEFDLEEFASENKDLGKEDMEFTIDSIEAKYVSLGATCSRK